MRWLDALWIEWRIALRFLADSPMQTLLIVVGIGVGSAVIVFITALVTGLQANTIERTLGTQAHIRFLAPDAVNLYEKQPNVFDLRLESPRAQRLQTIINWQAMRDTLDQETRLRAVSPLTSGPAIARRGAARSSVNLLGIELERYQRIIPLNEKLIAGTLRLSPGHALIGRELAEDLGVTVGDKVRLDGGDGREAVVDIAAIFEMGVRELDARYVYLDLKQAQTLLNLPGGVTAIDTTVDRLFDAETIAQRLAALTGLKAESWMATNSQILNALRSQTMTTQMIRIFVGLSVRSE
ncbi:MAG: ABC transporter permease, partial [Pseudomonas sp.]